MNIAWWFSCDSPSSQSCTLVNWKLLYLTTVRSCAPESSFLRLSWGCSDLLYPPRTPPIKPKARFLNGHQSKGSSGRGSAECWEMRLSVQTDWPSILQCPPYQNLTARESVERKGLAARIVIGLGYQRVDEPFKTLTWVFSVHKMYVITGLPLCFFDNKQHKMQDLIPHSVWVVEAYKSDCRSRSRKSHCWVYNFMLPFFFFAGSSNLQKSVCGVLF